MDIYYSLNETLFVWDSEKARTNIIDHNGIRFEQAATVFFDPFFTLVDASRNNETREAIIGFDDTEKLLFVVHIQIEDSFIRIISARKATSHERQHYEHS